LIGITSGGRLAGLLREGGFPVIEVPDGLPPRSSLGWGLGCLIRTLELLGVLSPQGEMIAAGVMRLQANLPARLAGILPDTIPDERPDPDGLPPVRRLAGELKDRVPVIYCAGAEGRAVGGRLKAQLNENSKLPAYLAAFPELDHNDLEGWCLDEGLRRKFALVILSGGDVDERLRERVVVTRELLRPQFAAVHELELVQGSSLVRLLSLVQYADCLSCHLADLRAVDPVPVARIQELKDRLGENRE
jgi:glucose/mannose-6-phosphate isomerase